MLLVRCFKGWAVHVKAQRNGLQERVARAKADLYCRCSLLCKCFDAWATYVALPHWRDPVCGPSPNETSNCSTRGSAVLGGGAFALNRAAGVTAVAAGASEPGCRNTIPAALVTA